MNDAMLGSAHEFWSRAMQSVGGKFSVASCERLFNLA
jgi:hypothetical protein